MKRQKLSLSVDVRLVEKAMRHCEREKRTLSLLVELLLEQLGDEPAAAPAPPPAVAPVAQLRAVPAPAAPPVDDWEAQRAKELAAYSKERADFMALHLPDETNLMPDGEFSGEPELAKQQRDQDARLRALISAARKKSDS